MIVFHNHPCPSTNNGIHHSITVSNELYQTWKLGWPKSSYPLLNISRVILTFPVNTLITIWPAKKDFIDKIIMLITFNLSDGSQFNSQLTWVEGWLKISTDHLHILKSYIDSGRQSVVKTISLFAVSFNSKSKVLLCSKALKMTVRLKLWFGHQCTSSKDAQM